MDDIKVGSRIKKILQEKDMQAKELAEKIGVSQAAMSNYLNDKRNIDNNYLSKISEILDVTTDELLGIAEKKKSRINRLAAGLNSLLEDSLKKQEEERIMRDKTENEIVNLLPSLDASQLDIILNLSKDLVNKNNHIKLMAKIFNEEF